MKIHSHENKLSLHCTFRGHEFDLSRDSTKEDWYAIVKTPCGDCVYDGWVTDSDEYTVKQVMIECCKGSEINPPKRWPRLWPPARTT